VAEGVIDLLEVIEVNEEKRDREAAGASASAGRIKALDERAAIEHAGQGIRLCTPFGFGERDALASQAIRNAQGDQHGGRHHRER
jgi:hypothetical protein